MDNKKIVGCGIAALVLLWAVGRIASSSSHAPEKASAVSAPTDKWHVTEARSPMDDSKTVVLTLDSDDVIRGSVEQKTPSLIVRCKEKKTEVYVVTGMAARIEEDLEGGPSAFHKVRLRFDDRAASYESWGEATDHRALFARDVIFDDRGDIVAMSGGAIAFAKKLAVARTLTFEFTPFDASPQMARFDMRGLDTRLGKVAEACGWSVE